MRGRINDVLRQLIALGVYALGVILQLTYRIRLVRFRQQQEKLRRCLRVVADTPIRLFGAETQRQIETIAQQLGDRALWAETSGTTNYPKRVLYTKRRLKMLKWIYIDSFSRMCASLGISRTSLYVFSSFDNDESLTNLLLDDRKLPGFFTTLQAPYRVQCDSSLRQLVNDYGSSAVRLWLLALSNPGVLYATNPSTIVAFLDGVKNNWQRVRQLAKDWHERQRCFPIQVRRIAARIDSAGSKNRIAAVANSDSPLELSQWVPGVKTYLCWTGGYVQPFLDRLSAYLPPHKYRLVPMYSMSTETVETIPCFHNSQTSFLPVAPGVLYEFLPEECSDEPEHLLRPDELVDGKSYSLVVSDSFGLRRYQTEDVFRCDGTSLGLPNLSFVRRRSLEYSFTGEKLTGEQLTTAYRKLEVKAFLTCVPCSSSTPHYRVFAVGECKLRDVSAQIDDHLAELNSEYRSKRLSGRLGAVTFENISLQEFLRCLPSAQSSWETQFKFLPLYRTPLNCEIEH